MTLFGIDRLLADPDLRRPLEGKRVALLAHPASVTADLTHSLDALVAFCHARDAQVIAEGVDTEQKQLCLHQAGCDLLQGFLVCPPRRLDELGEWQRQRLGNSSPV